MAIDILRGPGATDAITPARRMWHEGVQPVAFRRPLSNSTRIPVCESAMPPEPLSAFAHAQRLEQRFRTEQAKVSEAVRLIEHLVEQNQRLHRALLDTLALLQGNSDRIDGNDAA